MNRERGRSGWWWTAPLLLLFLALGWYGIRPHPGAGEPAISSIQGRGHYSPLAGRRVTTRGIVTAVGSGEFVIQDHGGDDDPATSDGLLVVADRLADLAPGDEVRVTGVVAERASGPGQLTTTRIEASSAVVVLARDRPLPPPVPLGPGGREPPEVQIIAPDELPVDLADPAGAGTNPFTPDRDAIDFYESLEGMRVTLCGPVAMSPTETRRDGSNDFFVLPCPGRTTDPASVRTDAGGIRLLSGPHNRGNQNPQRVRIRLEPSLASGSPRVAVGDRMADLTGVLGYAFGAFQVRATEPVRLLARSSWRPETTALVRGRSRLTLATYNVLNLSAAPEDAAQRARVGRQIARALSGPDILALQEIQDASGEADDGTVDAGPTLRALADAVRAAGGPRYAAFDVAPKDGRAGGAPGGNIRNAFLYDSTRVRLLAVRSLSRADFAAAGAPSPDAFAGARDPLLGEFEFAGRRLTVINNHLSSRWGSTPVFGAVQPFVQAGEEAREAQVRGLRAYVARLLDADRGARVVVLGDMNTFEFSDELAELLPGTPPVLENLIWRVRPGQRYSYIFEGNSQVLDHIFVTPTLAERAEVDIVHLNVDFPAGEVSASDHEPVVARFAW